MFQMMTLKNCTSDLWPEIWLILIGFNQYMKIFPFGLLFISLGSSIFSLYSLCSVMPGAQNSSSMYFSYPLATSFAILPLSLPFYGPFWILACLDTKELLKQGWGICNSTALLVSSVQKNAYISAFCFHMQLEPIERVVISKSHTWKMTTGDLDGMERENRMKGVVEKDGMTGAQMRNGSG